MNKNNELYIKINGAKKLVMLGLEAPFPEAFRARIQRSLKEKKIFLLKGNEIIISGFIIIPIRGIENVFTWMIWVRIKQEDFFRNIDRGKRKVIDEKEPTFATLESNLPYYSDSTSGLQVALYPNKLTKQGHPLVSIVSESELKTDQINGVNIRKISVWMQKLYSGNITI